MKRATIREIIASASEMSGVSREQLCGDCRTRDLAHVRFAIAWTARRATAASFPFLGTMMGGRHHTTMMHAARMGEQLRQRDEAFRSFTDALLASATAD